MPASEGVGTSAKFSNFLERADGIKKRSVEAAGGSTGGTGRGGKKHGAGVQEWPDGSRYEGEFMNGLKQGKGVFTWANGELYEGSFYKDYRHGNGTYSWPGGYRFKGKFYRNRKEGYGAQHSPDGTVFQGLYHADERFGPGVVTYPDGRQDVGLWHRERLLKLCSRVPGAFTLNTVPGYTSWVSSRGKPAPGHTEPLMRPHQEWLEGDCFTLPPDIETYSTDSDHLPLPHCIRKDLDLHFFQQWGQCPDEDPPTSGPLPLQLRMQAHIHRHRFEAEAQDWDVAAVLSGDREGFGPRGPLELTSDHLIQAASRGDLQTVHRILREGAVHPDVGDVRGHTALIAASINCHNDVIHLLLDCGADVNKLNGEGMSALAVCSVLYYPFDSLHETVAETASQNVLNSSQNCEMQSALGSSPQESTAEAEEEPSKIQDNETNPTNLTRAAGFSADWDKPKPAGTTRHEVQSIQVLDGNIPVGSVSWPETGTSLEEEFVFADDSTFDSVRSQASLRVQVTENALQQTAEALSRTRLEHPTDTQETVRNMALMKTKHRARWATMKLLLGRGGDPNASSVPMPVLFLAIKAAHVQAVRHLLECGARTDVPLPPEMKGLYPLHIAAGLPGPEGPRITELLLHALADPDVQAQDADEVFELDKNMVAPQADYIFPIPEAQHPKEGGRTPLHVACQRDTHYPVARDVVSLLLSHKANANLLWSGHSALSLAIASGNDLAVDELLAWRADPNLPLTRHVGSALCAVANFTYEHGQNPRSRTKLLEKLIKAGANILMPVVYGEGRKSAVGTAVDYAHYAFQQDRRIAHTPYHALNSREREVYNARRQLLAQMGDLLRQAAVWAERQQLEREQSLGIRSVSPTEKFLYIGAGATSPNIKHSGVAVPEREEQRTKVIPSLEQGEESQSEMKAYIRKPLFRYCYQCGRSVGVALAVCSRCREVFYCSKSCKMKAWDDRHKDECIRVSGRAKNRSCTPKKARVRPATTPHRGSMTSAVRKQTATEPKDTWELKENYSFN